MTQILSFQIDDLSFVLSFTGANVGIKSFDLAVSHPEGESTVFELQLWRGEWHYHGERGDSPLPVHALALAIVARFNTCGYYDRLLSHHPYNVEAMAALALDGFPGLARPLCWRAPSAAVA